MLEYFDFNHTDIYGNTPLHYAILQNIKLPISINNIENIFGFTPYDVMCMVMKNKISSDWFGHLKYELSIPRSIEKLKTYILNK